jgi:hypothetical protein
MIQRLNAALEGRYQVERELGAGGMAIVCGSPTLPMDRIHMIPNFLSEVEAKVGG